MNDYLQEVLFDTQAGCQMAITAENLAEKYGITREEADDYGFRSQTAFAAAHEAGRYADEIVPVTIPSRPQIPSAPHAVVPARHLKMRTRGLVRGVTAAAR